MKIAIYDDEKIFRDTLKKSLNKYSSEYELTFLYFEYSDGISMLSDNISYDLIFMDYKMKNMNGINVISALRERNNNTTVIFISSYKEMVFESMKVQTYRFLVKPLENEKLFEALTSFLNMQRNEKFILLKDDSLDLIQRVSEDSILYAEADNIYCKIRTSDNTYTYKRTLSHFGKELTSDFFFRTHRSYIVNFKYIESYTKNEIHLINNERALLSKNKYHMFQNSYITFLKRNSMGI